LFQCKDNAEIQRRCQEVINACWALGNETPIDSIHDVGAGGLSNALPELVHDAGKGAVFQLRNVLCADSALSPMEIWCNESQERYVLAIKPNELKVFEQIAKRERCPYAVVGHATEEQTLVLADSKFDNKPIDLSMSLLFGKPPKMHRNAAHRGPAFTGEWNWNEQSLLVVATRVLRFPTVASKSFLITIGDRTVTGLVARDQMAGPWQIPVSDVGVTTTTFHDYFGEAMAIGERTPLALLHPEASGRMAIGEALTNIAAAHISDISSIRLSANWMVSAGHEGEDAGLFDTVRAVGMELCPKLGIAIPVGKDSMSMKTKWNENGKEKVVTAPLSLIVSAFAPVADVRKTLTPTLITDQGETRLLFIDLAKGKQRLGGSIFAQAFSHLEKEAPDLEHPELLKAFFQAIQGSSKDGKILAYHDRSDGGLFSTLAEMAFAGRTGLDINIDSLKAHPLQALFNEELGAVIQVKATQVTEVVQEFKNHHFPAEFIHDIGAVSSHDNIIVNHQGQVLLSESRVKFQQIWSQVSYKIQSMRDNPECAQEEYDDILDVMNPGLHSHLTFNLKEVVLAANFLGAPRPKVAILREQGVNGHVEMAYAFDKVGFQSVDVHMSEILSGQVTLDGFKGIVACGGFSYGDVLGAGEGWAKSILFNPKSRDEFVKFFKRTDTFTLGVCNGCQMLSNLKELIPGADHWPRFVRNKSEQFEARVCMVEVIPTLNGNNQSIFFRGLEGSRFPIAVAHGEGHIEGGSQEGCCLRFVDNYGKPTNRYPANPNGSLNGMTGFTSRDGRVTVMMPHPERVTRSISNSWIPKDWSEDGPTLAFFANARKWVHVNGQ